MDIPEPIPTCLLRSVNLVLLDCGDEGYKGVEGECRDGCDGLWLIVHELEENLKGRG